MLHPLKCAAPFALCCTSWYMLHPLPMGRVVSKADLMLGRPQRSLVTQIRVWAQCVKLFLASPPCYCWTIAESGTNHTNSHNAYLEYVPMYIRKLYDQTKTKMILTPSEFVCEIIIEQGGICCSKELCQRNRLNNAACFVINSTFFLTCHLLAECQTYWKITWPQRQP